MDIDKVYSRIETSIDMHLGSLACEKPVLIRFCPINKLSEIECMKLAKRVGDYLMKWEYSLNDEFEITQKNNNVILNAIKWAIADNTMLKYSEDNKALYGDPTKNLIIKGDIGTGKRTILKIMFEIARALEITIQVSNKERSIIYWKTHEATALVKAYQLGGFAEVDKLLSSNIIAILNVGDEPKEANYMGTKANVMRYVLESFASREDKLLILTTCYSAKELSKLYKKRAEYTLTKRSNWLIIR